MSKPSSMHPHRRRFLQHASLALLAALGTLRASAPDAAATVPNETTGDLQPAGPVTLLLAGDVMTGRAIDQALPHPGSARLHEPYLNSAQAYLHLAEQASGGIPRPVDFAYVWGDALEAARRGAPHARIVNLETAITTSGDWRRGKQVHYRMHPANAPCLAAFGIDCCALANNHVLDWGPAGLAETLATLRSAGIRSAGAGADLDAARMPAELPLPGGGRLLVFAFGTADSGIPRDWAAGEGRPGVHLLADLSRDSMAGIAAQLRAARGPGDLVVASVHWGGNWGYAISAEHRAFARALIDEAGVHLVHGHSSHHPRGIEVHRGRPILYGCGDLVNDYEGIGGNEEYRPDLRLLYFARLDPAEGALLRLTMAPFRMRRLRLNHASEADAEWLRETLDREGRGLGTRVERTADGRLELRWR